MKNNISINDLTNPLVELLVEKKNKLSIEVLKGPLKCRVIDAGIDANGSVEAGIIISKICLGGLGEVNLNPNEKTDISSYNVNVYANHVDCKQHENPQ